MTPELKKEFENFKFALAELSGMLKQCQRSSEEVLSTISKVHEQFKGNNPKGNTEGKQTI